MNGGSYDGPSNSVYSLTKTDLSQWILFGRTQQPRYGGVAFLVPDVAIYCEGDPFYQDDMLKDDELIEALELE